MVVLFFFLLYFFSEFEELTYKKKPDLDPAIFEAYARKKFISWFERRVGEFNYFWIDDLLLFHASI